MNLAPSRAICLFGTEQVGAPLRRLQAGALSVEFDNGALRYVRVGDVEAIRGIAFLVRDENWGTLTPSIGDVSIDETPDRFSIRYRAVCADASRRLAYLARIEGTMDGKLSFTVEAEPETDVLTNRTGFVVLHPIEDLAGQPVRVLHVDGREERSVFPRNVDPRCPFTDIRALSHEIAPGTWMTCMMDGDAFEMEDQRNWSDASYKTYVRPLRRPWPYRLAKGEKFDQAVRLEVSGQLAAAPARRRPPVRLAPGRPIGRMPHLGIGVPAEETAHALAKPELIKRLKADWMVCEMDLRRGHGRSELERYAALQDLSGTGIVLEIITRGTLDPFAELEPLAIAARTVGLKAEAVSVFPAQDMKSVQPGAPWPEMPSFEQTYAAARRAFPNIKLGGGMAAYFTELNRKRPPADVLDYVTFTTCPSVHAADDVSVMETLETIPHLIRSTRAFMGEGLPVRIGPSQLGCRENAYGTSTAPNPANERVCLSRVDPRQRGLFNAAWTLGYIAACAREGVEGLALGAPSGPFGHVYRKTDFAQPWYDGQAGDSVYPAFHVMAGLCGLGGATLLAIEGVEKGLEAICIEHGPRREIWLANLTATKRSVEIADAQGESLISIISADRFERAASDPAFLDKAMEPLGTGPVELDAYAVARITLERGP